jgi:hypothetical protein
MRRYLNFCAPEARASERAIVWEDDVPAVFADLSAIFQDSHYAEGSIYDAVRAPWRLLAWLHVSTGGE